MNSSEKLFGKLESFNQSDESGQTAEQRLSSYCSQVLGAVERIHFDFKEKHDSRDADLHDDDKKNLAKAVSGFANSAGGVLIWGVADNNLALKPVADIERFTAKLLELAPSVVEPRAQGIDGAFIRSDTNPTVGYSIVHVPESSLPPHRVLLNFTEVKNHYYIRSGSTFSVAPHVQLEDMFGRRPRPQLALSYRIVPNGTTRGHPRLLIFVGIENRGRGAARAPYLALTLHGPYPLWRYGIDGNGNLGLSRLLIATDIREERFGGTADALIHSGVVHDVVAVEAEVNLSADITPDLVVDYTIAADGIMPIHGQLCITSHMLRNEAEHALSARKA